MAEYITEEIKDGTITYRHDVCELIRCRDCVHFNIDKCYCNMWKAKNQPAHGFCHFAEKEESTE